MPCPVFEASPFRTALLYEQQRASFHHDKSHAVSASEACPLTATPTNRTKSRKGEIVQAPNKQNQHSSRTLAPLKRHLRATSQKKTSSHRHDLLRHAPPRSCRQERAARSSSDPRIRNPARRCPTVRRRRSSCTPTRTHLEI